MPDNAHLTGVVLRLNDDGTTPKDNPFFQLGRRIGGEVGANIQKIFAYGIRNSFGMAVDPRSGDLWNQENGDDSFDEINRITAGQNNGWVQFMGPVGRIAEFKDDRDDAAVLRACSRSAGRRPTSPTRPPKRWRVCSCSAARTTATRSSPGSRRSRRRRSGSTPAGRSGASTDGDLFVGAARPTLDAGYLMRFNLSESRRSLAFSDPRLADRVADNAAKFDATESETLRFGTGFGVGTDIQTGPNGNLFVVSLSNGAIYEIHKVR